MDARVGGFTARKKALDGGLPVEVGQHTAAQVVCGRHHGVAAQAVIERNT